MRRGACAQRAANAHAVAPTQGAVIKTRTDTTCLALRAPHGVRKAVSTARAPSASGREHVGLQRHAATACHAIRISAQAHKAGADGLCMAARLSSFVACALHATLVVAAKLHSQAAPRAKIQSAPRDNE